MPLYDDIGSHYSKRRQTDPRIASQLHGELKGARRIVNIGAGTGSYEPTDVDLVAVEPSLEMIKQRKNGAHKVEQACAEQLPFENDSFSHAMTVLSMHHWSNRQLAFSEINRVATHKFVAITWDPRANPFWLTRDYFPEIYTMDKEIFPDLRELDRYFDEVDSKPLLIPSDCSDGFLAAFWRRPQAYLDPRIRQSMSSFSLLKEFSTGVRRLEEDLENGAWMNRNHAILNSSYLDAGYRIITAKIRES